MTPSTNNNPNVIGNEDVGGAAAAGVIEAPPPYCLVDPSKIRNMDHLPHYSHISPVEIIDLNTNSTNNNEHVKRNFFLLFKNLFLIYSQSTRHHNQAAVAAWLSSGSNMDIGTDCTFLMAL